MKNYNFILCFGFFIFLNNFHNIYSNSETCKKNWTYFENFCYLLINEEKTWQEAKTICKDKGSQLVSIYSETQNAYLAGQIKNYDFWTSGNDALREGDWKWANGKKIEYYNWGYGEPNNQYNEDCLVVERNKRWKDFPCGKKISSFFCQYSEGGEIEGSEESIEYEDLERDKTCKNGWKYFDNSCYWFVNHLHKTWTEASSICEEENSHLVSIESLEEDSFLHDHVRGDYWTSGNIINKTEWTWDENSVIAYNNWFWEPEEGTELPCLYIIYGDGLWDNIWCTNHIAFVCEREKGAELEISEVSDNKCKEGWQHYGTSCYLFREEEKSWAEAEKACKHLESDLVTIFTSTENRYLQEQMNTDFWTSGNDFQQDNDWYWANQRLINYNNWNPDIIWRNLYMGDPECLAVDYINGYWSLSNCDLPKSFICQYLADPKSICMADSPLMVHNSNMGTSCSKTNHCSKGYECLNYVDGIPSICCPHNEALALIPQSCKEGWKEYKDACYLFVENDMASWKDASIKCQDLNSQLADVQSEEELLYLRENIGSSWVAMEYYISAYHLVGKDKPCITLDDLFFYNCKEKFEKSNSQCDEMTWENNYICKYKKRDSQLIHYSEDVQLLINTLAQG